MCLKGFCHRELGRTRRRIGEARDEVPEGLKHCLPRSHSVDRMEGSKRG